MRYDRRHKNYDEALHLGERMKLIYDRGDFYTELGYLYVATKKYKQAIKYLQKAVEYSYFSPKRDVADMAHELGNCYFKIGNIDKAIYWTEKALELNPSTIEKKIRAIFNLSIYYYYKKQYKKTFLYLDKAKTLTREHINKLQKSGKKVSPWYYKIINEMDAFEERLKKKLSKEHPTSSP